MKILFLVLLSLPAMAKVAWFPVEKTGANTNWASKELCEQNEGTYCLNVAVCPLDECKMADEMEADTAKPKWGAEIMHETCADVDGCSAILKEKKCPPQSQSFIKKDFSAVYCATIIGYKEKKSGRKTLVPDEEKLAAKAAKEVKEIEAKIKKAAVKLLRTCLEDAMTLLAMQLKGAKLSDEQAEQMAKVSSLLQVGALDKVSRELNGSSYIETESVLDAIKACQ